MGVYPVQLFHDVEDVAATVEDGKAYLLYLHCERASAESMLGRFEDMNKRLVAMNKAIIQELKNNGDTEDLKYDEEGNAHTSFPLPTNLIASHCMIMPVAIDFERFPEMREGFGLQELAPLELLQWLGVIMRIASRSGPYTSGSYNTDGEEVDDDDFLGYVDLYRDLFSFYDQFAPLGKSQMYDMMGNIDFTDTIQGFDSETPSGEDV